MLIVDDSAQEQFLLKEMLRGNEFRFSLAGECGEAFELALQDPPDIVLAALRAVGPDALQLEGKLRQHPLTQSIPMLLLATAKHLGTRNDFVRTEMLDCLLRPFTVGQLLDRVQAQLRVSSLLRENERESRGAAIPGTQVDWELIGRTKKHLEQYLGDIRRLRDVADALSVPERRLAHAFQNCLGISVVEYIRQERMRKAKYLLTHTTRSVREIAQTVGFSSAANFSTAFDSMVGVSPSSFRNQTMLNALALDRGLHLK
ncbi:helix-turn-helix domain-containing protein [Pusillimonas sp.]|uniref:helix-turn-helix domain-containing protein n=1 Tax=Pusillimonas sp. TaxID=3040095 RepID=UPI0037CB509D